MITDGIREYMARDWKLLETTASEDDPAEALARADEMRVWGQLLHPDWPDPSERAEDLATKVRVAEAMRRAFPRRS